MLNLLIFFELVLGTMRCKNHVVESNMCYDFLVELTKHDLTIFTHILHENSASKFYCRSCEIRLTCEESDMDK